jgi:hypothetical protein
MFNAVSTNGSSRILVQLGTSSGVTTSGYFSSVSDGGGQTTSTAGFLVNQYAVANLSASGLMTICSIGSNTWSESIIVSNGSSGSSSSVGGGNITLSATLDRVRITTVNGTDTFDAGSINILYE